jgi:pilus assembly protein Flp/PilA
MKALMLKLWNDESGATMVEYGLMIALIAVICIGAVSFLGSSARANFAGAADAMGDATEAQCTAAGGTAVRDPLPAGAPAGAVGAYKSCQF